MVEHRSDCVICGARLVYSRQSRGHRCEYRGGSFRIPASRPAPLKERGDVL